MNKTKSYKGENMISTAVEVHKAIEQEAVNRTSVKTGPEIQVKQTCAIGKGIRQGDIYVIRVNDSGPTQIEGFQTEVDPSKCISLGGNQLAIGNTMGSRHTIDNKQAKFFTDPTSETQTFGGIVKSETRWCLSHPEHDHWDMPEGTYAIFYQLDWSTQQRVRD